MNNNSNTEGRQEEIKHNEDANVYIDRAIEMLKDEYKYESMIAGYNGIVSLLTYAKESHARLAATPSPVYGKDLEEMAMKKFPVQMDSITTTDGNKISYDYNEELREAFKAGYAASQEQNSKPK